MCDVLELLKARRRITELEAQIGSPSPLPPTSNVVIDANALMSLLRPHGIVLSGGTSDYGYLLMSKAEGQSFLDWYRDKHPYTADDYDCDKFAWCMRADAIRWMHGKYVWGYIEAEGKHQPDFTFPNHGFNFVVFDDLSAWFCDELCLAAPEDGFTEAYPVKCHMAKA